MSTSSAITIQSNTSLGDELTVRDQSDHRMDEVGGAIVRDQSLDTGYYVSSQSTYEQDNKGFAMDEPYLNL